MAENNWFQNKLGDASKEKLLELEYFADLKSYHLLSSEEGYSVLQKTRSYDMLLKEAEKKTGLHDKDLDPNIVFSLCEYARDELQARLSITSIKNATPENRGIYAVHLVKSHHESNETSMNYTGVYHWQLNYEEILMCYLEAKNNEDIQSKIQGQGEKKQERILTMAIAIDLLINSDNKFITSVKFDRAISFQEFEKDEQYRSSSEEYVAIPRKQYRDQHPDGEFLSDERLDELRGEEEIDLLFNQLKKRTKGFMKNPIPTAIAKSIYKSKPLYQRAVNDLTLRRFWVERKIALACVWERGVDGGFAKEDISVVDYALEVHLKRRERAKGKIAEYKEANCPEIIIRNTEKSYEQNAYFYQAISKNKKWLTTYFQE